MSHSEDLGQLVSELTVAQLIQLAVVLDIPATDLLAIATDSATTPPTSASTGRS